MFAGESRRCDVRECLRILQGSFGLDVEIVEVDIVLQGSSHDLSDADVWRPWLSSIERGEWDFVLITPPCNSFSRLPWANRKGPRPCRSFEWPYGFPSLEGDMRRKAEKGNFFIFRTLDGFRAQAVWGGFLGEHPEDLGQAELGRPASIWQWKEMKEFVADTNALTAAFFQCDADFFGAPPSYEVADYPKPTRVVSDAKVLQKAKYKTWPVFDDFGGYQGPLPRWCGHHHKNKLTADDDPAHCHRSAPAASYKASMCYWLAHLICSDIQSRPTRRMGSKLSRAPSLPTCEGPPSGRGLREVAAEPRLLPEARVQAEAASENDWDSQEDWALHDTTDEGEDGERRPKLGEGRWGRGPPLTVARSGRERSFEGGAGLCSPGRWRPQDRAPPAWPGINLIRAKLLLRLTREHTCLKSLVMKISAGEFKECPFSAELLDDGRAIMCDVLELSSHRLARRPREELLTPPEGQPFYLHLLAEVARRAGDPDTKVLNRGRHSFAEGVPIGVRRKMPRTPAVFARKVRWRALDETQEDFDMGNYKSARDALPVLVGQMQEEAAEGLCEEVTEEEARRRYPGSLLRVAALGAIAKSEDSFRILHDATHGVRVNPELRQRDQVRMPSAPEGRAVLGHAYLQGTSAWALKLDAHKAHRRYKVRRKDWGRQACRLRDKMIWLNRVGTFGVGTAGYWFQRLASVPGRLVLYCMLCREFWQLIYADDVYMLAQGPHAFEDLALAALIWTLLGTPFSWHKAAGGLEVDWIGYWMDCGRFQMGLSAERFQWLLGWLEELLRDKCVLVRVFISGLGKLSFAVSVLDHHRPCLAPLFAWAASVPPASLLGLPVLILVTLTHLRKRLVRMGRALPCRPLGSDIGEVFRADARAEEHYAVIGGWECAGGKGPREARWFSARLSKDELPEFFERGSAQRTIAAWELLATMVSVRLFTPSFAGSAGCGVTGATDNQGNSYVVAKMSTQKFPLCTLTLQLAEMLEEKGLHLHLYWLQRDSNAEADALTNDEEPGFPGYGFQECRRVPWSFKREDWPVLKELLELGAGFYGDLEAQRAARTAGAERLGPDGAGAPGFPGGWPLALGTVGVGPGGPPCLCSGPGGPETAWFAR